MFYATCTDVGLYTVKCLSLEMKSYFWIHVLMDEAHLYRECKSVGGGAISLPVPMPVYINDLGMPVVSSSTTSHRIVKHE